MGLDMYLTGEKSFMDDFEDPSKNIMEDGFRLRSKRYELGYWRKHPNLHGYMVQSFASGVDDCREIYLTEPDIREVISAIKTRKLPFTEGFFFGVSQTTDERIAEDVAIFQRALLWVSDMENRVPGEYRMVIYQASW